MAYNDTEYLSPNQSDDAVAGAPLGEGAHFFHTGADQSVVELYRSTVLDGTKLADLGSLSYSTFAEATSSGSGVKQPAYLRLSLDSDGDGAGDASLFYEPAHNGTVTDSVWQTWDAAASDALWSIDGSYADPKTLVQLKAAYPDATIVASTDPAALSGSGMGGLAFIVGAAGDNQIDGRFGLDQVGVNGTTYDLEPTLTVPAPGGGGSAGTSAPTPPPAPEGTTDAQGAASSDVEGTATATSGETTVAATGMGAFTVAQYEAGNPVAVDAPIAGDATFFDVLTSEGSDFSSLAVTQCGLAADAHSVVWFDGERWLKASPTSFAEGCATLVITDQSSPNLDELTGTVFAAGELPVTRLAGRDRIDTAVEVSQERFPVDGSAKAVVLARSDAYPDALSGAPLANRKQAPLLLTRPNALDSDTLSEIRRVTHRGATVFMLGGKAALAPSVRTALREAGYVTKRLAGDNRYSTATAIATALGSPETVFEVPGTGFADALSAGPVASQQRGVILLTRGARQAEATSAYLAAHPAATRYAIGGLSAAADPQATKISGQDRYGTSAKVASAFFDDATAVHLATGLDYPDALSGGPIATAPILLVRGDAHSLPTASRKFLQDAASTVTTMTALGGEEVLNGVLVAEAQRMLQ